MNKINDNFERCGLAIKIYPHWTYDMVINHLEVCKKAITRHLIYKGYCEPAENRIEVRFEPRDGYTRVKIVYAYTEEDSISNNPDYQAKLVEDMVEIGE